MVVCLWFLKTTWSLWQRETPGTPWLFIVVVNSGSADLCMYNSMQSVCSVNVFLNRDIELGVNIVSRARFVFSATVLPSRDMQLRVY